MKNFLMLMAFVAIIFGSNFAKAQDAYEEGDKILSAGISLGSYSYGYAGSRGSSFVPLLGSFEFGISRLISVGPYLGYHSYSYDWLLNEKYRISYLTFGAKGSVHLSEFMNDELNTNINLEKLDLYSSLYLGLQVRSDNYSGPGEVNSGVFGNTGITVGGKYMFNPGIGAFLELGYGAVGVFTFGVAARF